MSPGLFLILVTPARTAAMSNNLGGSTRERVGYLGTATTPSAAGRMRNRCGGDWG